MLPIIANNNVPAAKRDTTFPVNFVKPWMSLTFDFSISANNQTFSYSTIRYKDSLAAETKTNIIKR
ncbi:hypothetical protein [Clostridium yunnanense]|uniref:hypothetical protein n=1 Tax=Clostridium yunnanense TaxID=2800325 RepID=UPI001903FCBC|nr:hypothetical protein [Clostridium yunnanense]